MNKVYSDNEVTCTAMVAKGCLGISRNNDGSVLTLNDAQVFNNGTHLTLVAQDPEIEDFSLHFANSQDLASSYAELSKWHHRTVESAYEITSQEIATGQEATIYYGLSPEGTHLAVKKLAYRHIHRIGNEVHVNVYLEPHENILTILDVMRYANKENPENSATYIIMQYLENTQGMDILLKTRMSENVARMYMRQILCGIAHLHTRGISHGDLNFRNIQFQEHLEKATIIDLGFSTFGIEGQVDDIRKCGMFLQAMIGDHMGQQVKELIGELFSANIRAAQAINHPWFGPTSKITDGKEKQFA